MNKKLALATIALVATVMVMSIVTPAIAGDRVEICHKGSTITVSANAVPAHIAHGDTLGSCDDVGCPPNCGGTAISFKYNHY